MLFTHTLLDWYNANKRELPWRASKDPYKVHLSEIILQQTRVNQGIPYFNNLLKHYPNVFALAESNEQELLNYWQGLGYYSRATNLRIAAQQIVNEYNGKYPEEYKELLKIKGIGKYTAAAIGSICFDLPVAAIDGNAFRVYARYFNIDRDVSKASTFKYFFELGNELIPKESGDWNQAIMELGATICTPKSPKCDVCPWKDSCRAREKNIQLELPVKLSKVKVKGLSINYIVFKNKDEILMKKRGTNSFWKKMYDFPEIEATQSLRVEESKEFTLLYSTEHILSHRKLLIKFWKAEESSINETSDYEWVNLKELKNIPCPKPIADSLKMFFPELELT